MNPRSGLYLGLLNVDLGGDRGAQSPGVAESAAPAAGPGPHSLGCFISYWQGSTMVFSCRSPLDLSYPVMINYEDTSYMEHGIL